MQTDRHENMPPVDVEASKELVDIWKELSAQSNFALGNVGEFAINETLLSALATKSNGPFRETYAYWLGEHLRGMDFRKALELFEESIRIGDGEGSICDFRTPAAAASESGGNLVLTHQGPDESLRWVSEFWATSKASLDLLRGVANAYEVQGDVQSAMDVLKIRMDTKIVNSKSSESQFARREFERLSQGYSGLPRNKLEKQLVSGLSSGRTKRIKQLPTSTTFSVSIGCHSTYVDADEFLNLIVDELTLSNVDVLWEDRQEDAVTVYSTGWCGDVFGAGVAFVLRRRGSYWFLDNVWLIDNPNGYLNTLPDAAVETNSPLPFELFAPWDKQAVDNRKSFTAGGLGVKHLDPLATHAGGAPWWTWFIPAGPTLWSSFPPRGLLSSCGYGLRGLYYGQPTTHLRDDFFAIDFTSYDGITRATEYTPVLAAAGGRVLASVHVNPDDSDRKNYVEVVSRHDDTDYVHRYLHLANERRSPVLCGSWVPTECYLGRMQMTGNAVIPHLHFSIHDQSRPYGDERLGSCSRIQKGHSIRPYPMAGTSLGDLESGKCVQSRSGGHLSVAILTPGDGEVVSAGERIRLQVQVTGGAFPIRIYWRSNREEWTDRGDGARKPDF